MKGKKTPAHSDLFKRTRHRHSNTGNRPPLYLYLICLLLASSLSCASVKHEPAEPGGEAQSLSADQVEPSTPQITQRETEADVESFLFDQAMGSFASSLMDQLPRNGPIRIAVFNFTTLNGTHSECGKTLAEILEAELVSRCKGQERFSLVERRELSTIMDEQKHNASDLVDDTQAIEIGKQLGATALLKTAMSPWAKGGFRAVAKIIDTESTKILAAASGDFLLPGALVEACTGDDQPIERGFPFVEAANPESPYHVNVWTDKAVYKLGEDVIVHAQSDKEGYLYLFDVDAAGRRTMLLPNFYHKGPFPVVPGETFTSPRGWYAAGKPAGRGYIKAVVTPEPLPLWNPDFSDLGPGTRFRSVSQAATRGVVVNTLENQGGFGTAWVTVEE